MYFRDSLRMPGVLNIFTDASKLDKKSIVSPGFIAVTTIDGEDVIVGQHAFVCDKSTNNNGEIRAVSLGLHYGAINKDKYRYINLFSDSKLCINTLRDWIYVWMRNQYQDPVSKLITLCTKTGTPVANQSEIIGCLRTIVSNNLNICLYHVKAHVTGTQRSLNEARESFIKHNNFSPDNITIADIEYLSMYNNMIDLYTTNVVNQPDIIVPTQRVFRNTLYKGFNLSNYSKLTNNSMLKKKGE